MNDVVVLKRLKHVESYGLKTRIHLGLSRVKADVIFTCLQFLFPKLNGDIYGVLVSFLGFCEIFYIQYITANKVKLCQSDFVIKFHTLFNKYCNFTARLYTTGDDLLWRYKESIRIRGDYANTYYNFAIPI